MRSAPIWAVLVFLLAIEVPCPGETAAPELLPVTGNKLRQEVVRQDALKQGAVVLVNMWATWCPPCREEFPDLLEVERAYRDRGLRLLLVSWDSDAATARRFLASQKVEFLSYIKSAEEGNEAFIEAFAPSWSGEFPACFLFDSKGAMRAFWEGKKSPEFISQKILEIFDNKETRP